jgi:hypothetical protein
MAATAVTGTAAIAQGLREPPWVMAMLARIDISRTAVACPAEPR